MAFLYQVDDTEGPSSAGRPCLIGSCGGTRVAAGGEWPRGWTRCDRCGTIVGLPATWMTEEQLLSEDAEGRPRWAAEDDWGRATCRLCGGGQSWEGEPDGYAEFLPEHVRHASACIVVTARRQGGAKP